MGVLTGWRAHEVRKARKGKKDCDEGGLMEEKACSEVRGP